MNLYKKIIVVYISILLFEATTIPIMADEHHRNQHHPIINDFIEKDKREDDNFCLGTVDIIDQQQVKEEGWGTGFYQELYLAQGFTPELTTLTKVQLKMFKEIDSSPDDEILVSIRESLYGSDLTVASVSETSIPHGGWAEFDVDDITVIPGENYYIVCLSTVGNKNQHYDWFYGRSNPYTAGQPYYSFDYGHNWSSYFHFDPNRDFCFRTYGKNSPPLTPETPIGVTLGIKGNLYNYTTRTVDPNGDAIWFQWDWGDGAISEWMGLYDSHKSCNASHKFLNGMHTILVKAKDVYDDESEWATLKIKMPKKHTWLHYYYQFISDRISINNILQKIFIFKNII